MCLIGKDKEKEKESLDDLFGEEEDIFGGEEGEEGDYGAVVDLGTSLIMYNNIHLATESQNLMTCM